MIVFLTKHFKIYIYVLGSVTSKASAPTIPRSLQIERSYKVQSFFVRSKPSVTRR